MAILIKSTPAPFSAAYSTLPLRVEDDTALNWDAFNYLVSLAWEEMELVDAEPTSLNGAIWNKLLVADYTKFKAGDKILIVDAGELDGVHGIQKINLNGELILDSQPGEPFASPLGYPKVYKCTNWKLSPDEAGEIKQDLHGVVKDLVSTTQEFLDIPQDVTGDRLNYYIFIHTQFKWHANMSAQPVDDGGNTQITLVNYALDTAPLKIGDKILLEWDQVGSTYTDNQWESGSLAFIKTGSFPFRVGQPIWVTGQITNPDYNGETTVTSVSSGLLITAKTHNVNTPLEGGSIWGHPRPEWNGVYKILDLQESGSNLLVTFDCPWTESLPSGHSIYGKVSLADNIVVQRWNEVSDGPFVAFPAVLPGAYVPNGMANQRFLVNAGNWASILTGTTRIEQTAKSWILGLNLTQLTGLDKVEFRYFDKDDNGLGRALFAAGSRDDVQFPIGVDQVLNSPDVELPGGAISVADIFRYEVAPIDLNGDQLRDPLLFELTHDCSRFELWQLIWRDTYGSWPTYPFKGAHTPSKEKEAKTYYNSRLREGFDDDGVFREKKHGDVTYFNRNRKLMELSTGWVAQDELYLIDDLFKSNQVYLMSPTGEIQKCTILDTQIPLNNPDQDLIQYTIQVAISNNRYNY